MGPIVKAVTKSIGFDVGDYWTTDIDDKDTRWGHVANKITPHFLDSEKMNECCRHGAKATVRTDTTLIRLAGF